MQSQAVRFCVCNTTPPLAIENVPAAVCRRCGHKEFSDKAIEVLDRVRAGRHQPVRIDILRVFDYEQLLQQHTESTVSGTVYAVHGTGTVEATMLVYA
jgi:hypothetical protein